MSAPAAAAPTRLKFRDLAPLIDVSFWFQLEHRKLHEWKLEEPTVPIAAAITSAQRNPAKLKVPNTVFVTGSSFETADATETSAAAGEDAAANSYAYKNASNNTMIGTLLNYNTPQQLDALDKKEALQETGNALLAAKLRAIDWARYDATTDADVSAGAISDAAAPLPSNMAAIQQCADALTFLNAIAMWTYADLKTHNFQYIVAFPAVDLESAVSATKAPANTTLTEAQLAAIVAVANAKASGPKTLNDDVTPFVAILDPTAGTVAAVLPLTPNNAARPNAIVVYNDASEYAEHPGWAIRNLLAALRVGRPATTHLKFLGLRDVNAFAANTSVVFDCSMEALTSGPAVDASLPFKIVGWATKAIERISMGSMMNPAALAESSSRLNISLMKWRMMPALDLDKIKDCKALLLGSGTLGCNIARHLMMWGVNHITMVDRGRVSYSNPVRQTLFEVEDVVQGRNKCDAAVAALKRILPTVNATAVNMTIRMPGHRVDAEDPEEVAKCREDVEQLEALIKSHDVVFELLDSREARWLPTVLATFHNKPVINTALGFDAYVVMRHGLRSTTDSPNGRLGCYFCNDVVAPVDSLTARTLDQQCTVTRPGVSAMASALTIEMLAALYNHPQFFECPAYKSSEDGNAGTHAHGATAADKYGAAECCLGIVPHQIRGSVADYSQLPMNGVYFPKCAACSEPIMVAFEKEGFPFILTCLNNPKHIETITGLEADRIAVEEKYGGDWDDDGWDE